MPDQLPSGRWRARVMDPKTRKQVGAHKIIGGAPTHEREWQARAAEDAALKLLAERERVGVTVMDWWTEWTTDPLWMRPAESTNLHNRERTAKFAREFGTRALASIGAPDVAAWLKGGKNRGTVMALRAMFNDARKPQAGALITTNPFASLGIERGKGRKHVQPPNEAQTWVMIDTADELTPPSFAAYLLTAAWSAARPGELDALKWDDLDFTPSAECIGIERQWNVKAKKITPPKHDSRRTIAMTEPVRERLSSLPRESEYVFTTVRGTHYTPSSRNLHWNRVRASVGIGNVSLYLATRHFFGWYALNVLEMAPHEIALQLGHDDGGELVRTLYGHPDAGIARAKTRERFANVGRTVTPLRRSSHASRHGKAQRTA